MTRRCACGHVRGWHRHLNRGAYCGACLDCGWWRWRPRLVSALFAALWRWGDA